MRRALTVDPMGMGEGLSVRWLCLEVTGVGGHVRWSCAGVVEPNTLLCAEVCPLFGVLRYSQTLTALMLWTCRHMFATAESVLSMEVVCGDVPVLC